ncbi:MAG: TonB-dependent receptor domain-containing protein [Terriglobia bacterium]
MGKRALARLVWIVAPLLILVSSLPVQGQTTTAALRGTVTDPAGAVVPGATITVRNVDTGRTYTTETNDLGVYFIPGLPPGSYTVTAEKEGFQRLVREGIVLMVNQEGVADLSLALGTIAQEVVVREGVSLVETEGATISGVVEEKQIKELPLNARDFYQLALLEPGVASIATNAFQSPWQNTTNGKFAANGMRPTMNTTVLDGSEVSDPGHNQPLGGVSGAAFGVDGTREFRVLTNMYTAEFGRNGGAVVQAVTSSGSNTVHGSVYEFIRNDTLDARNFFDDPTAPIPKLRRNQFGFSLGGPIAKDRTFFFFNYEGFRERKGETQSFTTFTAAQRVGAAPEIVPFLNFYPLPNVPGSSTHRTSAVRETDEDYFVIRVDHQLGSNDSLTVRYLFDEGDSLQPFMSTPVPGFEGLVDNRNQFLVITEQHTFSPSLLNVFRASFNRLNYTQAPARVDPGLSIALGLEEKPIGQISVGGLPPLGHALTIPVGQQANIFHFLDNLTYSVGKHVVKAGVDVRRFQVNGPFDLGVNGSYTFFSPADFVAGNVGFFLGTSPTSPDSNRGYRQTNFAAFFQDEFRVTPNLTLNLGLRYEYNSSPSEQHGRNANIRDPLNDTSTTVGKIFDPPAALFAPRLGVAWSPFGHGRTVIRGGIGMFYDLIKQDIYGDVRWLPPFFDLVLGGFGPGTFRNLGVILPFGISVPIQFDIDQPYALAYNVQIQQELTPNTLLTVGYVGSRGNHLTRSGEANPSRIDPATGAHDPALGLLNPNFGSILQIVTDAQSFYNSFQLGLERRFSQGLFFQASYTLSKSIDDASGPFLSDFLSEIGVTQDLFDRKNNRGLSAYDARHNFVFNILYELPFGPGKSFSSDVTGAAARLVEGWQIGSILTLNSAFPFTVRHADNPSQTGAVFFADRPDLVPGRTCEATGDPLQWFDPSAFQPAQTGFFGTAGRNICRGPDFKNLDFSILKNTQVSERVNIQFRVEFFNLTNHPNFGPPINTQNPNGSGGNGDAVFAAGSPLPLANAGEIFRTVNESRQIQFGLKIIF